MSISTANLQITKEKVPQGEVIYITFKTNEVLPAEAGAILPLELPEVPCLAIVNHSPFWCRPEWAAAPCEIPRKTQELLFCSGDTWEVVLPVCDRHLKTVLQGGEAGAEAVIYSNVTGPYDGYGKQLSLIHLIGKDPLQLFREAAAIAAQRLDLKLRSERKVSPIFEYLGWCSWDAFHVHVNHEGLLKKVQEFRGKELPVGFAVLDDMWADVPDLYDMPQDIDFHDMVEIMHQSPLKAFSADPTRFPYGMAETVRMMKEAGIPQVGLWFPTTGYWKGILPGSPAEQELREELTMTQEYLWGECPEDYDGMQLVDPHPETAKTYFRKLVQKAKDWGLDFVKVDNQGCHTLYKEILPIGESGHNMAAAIDQAAELMDGALINCMGMPSECMFSRPNSAISRCSDDFMPESPEWFSKNILQCSYNGLLQGQFYVNDWDMWWTDDAQAGKNALCRAISGGPVYISDPLGRTRPEVLSRVVLSSGRILRCDDSAIPTADCLIQDPTVSGKPFKLWNRKGKARLTAVFDLQRDNTPVRGTLSAKDVDLGDKRCAYYEFFSGAAGILEPGDTIALTLKDRDDYRLYTLIPMEGEEAVFLGRTDLFVGIGAYENEVLIEGGPCAVISERPVTIVNNGVEIPTEREGILLKFTAEAGMLKSE